MCCVFCFWCQNFASGVNVIGSGFCAVVLSPETNCVHCFLYILYPQNEGGATAMCSSCYLLIFLKTIWGVGGAVCVEEKSLHTSKLI